jgi:acetate kinase
MDEDRTVASTTAQRWEGEGHLEPIKDFLERVDDVDVVGHRVVHGGPRLNETAG